MHFTATREEIEAHRKEIELGKISPRYLPPCSICRTLSEEYKVHGLRKRIFLVLVEVIVTKVKGVLLRFKCPGCNTTFTYYPSFALPYKRFTAPTIVHCCQSYTENKTETYVTAAMINKIAPGYKDDGKILMPSTVHRWITSLANLKEATRRALKGIMEENPASSICRDQARLTVSGRKYRSQAREEILLICRRLFSTEKAFVALFDTSIFTRLARSCNFT